MNGLERDDLAIRYYRDNSLVCCEDDMPRKIFVIRKGRAKAIRKIEQMDGTDPKFIIAGILVAGDCFGFPIARKRDSNLYLVSSGCEVIIIDWSIYDRMINVKVNANLTILKEKSCIISHNEAKEEISDNSQWNKYKYNLIKSITSK